MRRDEVQLRSFQRCSNHLLKLQRCSNQPAEASALTNGEHRGRSSGGVGRSSSSAVRLLRKDKKSRTEKVHFKSREFLELLFWRCLGSSMTLWPAAPMETATPPVTTTETVTTTSKKRSLLFRTSK